MRRLTVKGQGGPTALALCLAPLGGARPGATAPVDPASTDGASPPAGRRPQQQASPTPSFFDVNKYRADWATRASIRVPGTNVAIFIGGFAQLDVISDLNVIGNPDQFLLSSIPVGGGTGNTGFS